MRCPFCKISMIVIEREQVELDYCGSCRGVWFDEGELELLLDDVTGRDSRAVLDDLMSRQPTECAEKKFRCPICRQPMQKVDIGNCGKLVVDACRSGHGLWFEAGEVGCLIGQLGVKPGTETTKQDRLLFFVADTFRNVGEEGQK